MKSLLKIVMMLFFMIQTYSSYAFEPEVECGITNTGQDFTFPRIPTMWTVRALIIFVRFNDLVFSP